MNPISIFWLVFTIGVGMGIPMSFLLGIAVYAYLMANPNIPLALLPVRFFGQIDSFVLLAIPFFMLAGSIMNEGGLTKRLIRFAQLLVGTVRGGLGQVSIVASMIFAGISGSALAETTAIGSIMIPSMEKEGYERDFSAAIIASASCIGPIIPPSIDAVIYASLTGVSVAGLFIANAIPGFLLGFFMMFLVFFQASKYGWKKPAPRALKAKEVVKIVREALLALIMPLIILGGILGGFATPTEAAVIAVVYALLVSVFVFREFNWKKMPELLLRAGIVSGTILFLIGLAGSVGWIMTIEAVPEKAAALLLSITDSKVGMMAMINVLLLICGCLMEPMAIMIMLIPVMTPIADRIGIDPVHFGAMFILNLVIGFITPPFGVCLYTTCSVAQISLEQLVRRIWPFILVQIGVLAMVAYIPPLTLWLPSLLK